MNVHKVLVGEDDRALLVCPHCRASKRVEVSRFRGFTGPIRVRCPCGSTFTGSLEFRQDPRKGTDLVGYFCSLPEPADWQEMVVANLSFGGLMFSPLVRHTLREGDQVKVRFRLNDERRSEIERSVVVRNATPDHGLHCRFTDKMEYTKALGFFLME